MRNRTFVHRIAPVPVVALLAALALWPAAPAALRADDRDLLRESYGEPLVFILFDTSGSMNWSTRCTPEDLAAGNCDRICVERDCPVPLNGDGPNAKFYQAKAALYEVLSQVDNIFLGFATYNQDQLRVRAKHWLYQATVPGVAIPGGGSFPAAGEGEVFGFAWACDNGTKDAEVGCYPGSAANMADPWDRTRMLRLPKGGVDFNQTQQFYIDVGGQAYRVAYQPLLGAYGDPLITVAVELGRCENKDCSNRTPIDKVEVTYRLLSDFVSWDFQPDRANIQLGYFSQGAASDSYAGNSCGGWDGNDDPANDPFNGYNLRFPTVPDSDPTLTPDLDYGDVTPLDWRSANKAQVLSRLAPNRLLGEAFPDFRTARYFRDRPEPGESFLRLKNDAVRPMVPFGSTPLGNSISAFREWWAGCPQGSCPNETGWSDIAAARDPDWACRKKYLLVISDGDDTCGGADPCSNTAALLSQENVRTYVVGFGVENTPHNRLVCMASNGGTGEPIFPQNRQELVDALTKIFGEIQEEARAFASAAVPSVQAETSDAIYLSSFTPLNNASIWDGHLDAFLKPLPTTPDGRPDESTPCSSLPADQQAECHLWDAGSVLLGQSPTPADVAANNLKLGNADDERRVFYPLAKNLITEAVPNQRRLFEPPTLDSLKQDLWDGLGLLYTVPDDLTTDGSVPQVQAEAVIRDILTQKTQVVDNADGTMTTISYILGDIFHSNPVVVENPGDFRAYSSDLYSDGTACADGNPGYRCFSEGNRWRRRMLAVGANDGQVHLFDAGVYDGDGGYDDGTGLELFSVMPRLTLPAVRELAEGATQIFSTDNTVRVVDVFIDPAHHSGSPPAQAEREWRTVAIGGLREGGVRNGGTRVTLDNGRPFTSGYFALDVTQPDSMNPDGTPVANLQTNRVPGCITNYNASDCGPVEFGAELWEFTDSVGGSPAEWGTALDEDQNGFHDLADTWSVPVIGRVSVQDLDGTPRDRFVAIFGGGFDRDHRGAPVRGNWLYMVDVETGETLYKHQLLGAVPSGPAAVDANRDGYIDIIYIGTTAGYLYKVDVSTPARTQVVRVRDITGVAHDVVRVTDRAWDPFIIFDTLAANTDGGDAVRRPIFFPPTVVVVAELSRFALAFGTGDRELLWDMDGTEGRFYFIVDENFRSNTAGLPMDESDYQRLDSESAFNPDADFILNPPAGLGRGWVMTLDPNERVVAQPFSVSGITVFPTFQPQVVSLSTSEGQICARTGDSRVFVVFSNNADPILPEADGVTSRSMLVGEALVTPPFVDQSATKNPSDQQQDPARKAWEDAIRESLEELFPPGTRFANYTIGVSFIRSDTGLVGPIPIPVGIVIKNWKEY